MRPESSGAGTADSGTEAIEDEVLERLLAEGETLAQRTQAEAYGAQDDHLTELYPPSDPAQGDVVLVHGGYFRPTVDRTHARPLARRLAAEGCRVWLPEYRRVPGSPWLSVEDLRAFEAWRASRAGSSGAARDVRAPRAIWVGHSAGGTLALLAADGADVLALAPVADLARASRERLGDGAVDAWTGEDAALLADLDPARRLADGTIDPRRVRVVHGADDATVPARHTRDLGGRVDGLEVTVLAGAHHFDVVDPASPHLSVVLALLRR